MRRTLSLGTVLPPAILIAAVSFNAVLAIVNGHVVALSRGHVVLAEIAIYVAAVAAILTHADRRMMPWFLLALFMVLSGLLIALGNGEFNPKYIRDVLVIPVFIMLGMTYRGRFTTPFLILHTIVFLVAVLELASPDVFSDLFKIIDYYVNTRDFSVNSFWNTESKLFISATRPGERFFSFVDWHRMSSIFLEPVSLGNYCVVAAILIAVCWAELALSVRTYLIGSTLFLLIGSDGRLATTSIGIVLAGSLLLRNTSTSWSWLYLPASLLGALLYVHLIGQVDDYDNFVGRVASTIGALSRLDIMGLLGLATQTADNAADNGIVYFILTQSTIGAIVIWLAICLLGSDNSITGRLYLHATALFVPLNLLISYSLFSIKVAALIWFAYGYYCVTNRATERVIRFDRRATLSSSIGVAT